MCITSALNLTTSAQYENIFYDLFQFHQSLFQITISKLDIYLALRNIYSI